jgi:hypothetical protein
MLRRFPRLKAKQQYSEAQTKRWLAWLAQSMVQQSQTVFLIEEMQHSWLQGKGKRILCLLGIFLMSWLVSWSIGGLIGRLSYRLMSGSSDLLISWLFYGLIYGLSFGLISVYSAKGKIKEIKEIKQSLKWSWKEARNGRRRLILSSIVGVGLFCWLYSRSIFELISNFILLLSFVLNIELICGGGKTCIPHLTLRLILYRDGYIPWNYSRFLDYAAERTFLQKVGGGYIFIHRLLLEHFAQMKLESWGL